jgi:phospholipid N-methyltransferase
MPTLDWLQREFCYGYSSGDVSTDKPDFERAREEKKIGGSYKTIVDSLLRPLIKPNHNVLELGPGRGSWSRAILKLLGAEGSLTTVDFQDVSKWIDPHSHHATITHYQVRATDYACLNNDKYDFFFSFGVLCHNNIENIYRILDESYSKLRGQAILVHQYSDWDKLEKYGWEKGEIPFHFKGKRDAEIWWTRNNQKTMQTVLESIGYRILSIDVNLVQRDSIFIAQKPSNAQ